MKNVDLLIFDLDGTLIDSTEDIAIAVNHALSTHGLPEITREEVTSYIGEGVLGLMQKSVGARQDMAQQVLGTFEHYYREHLIDNLAMYPHVKEVLEHFGDKRKTVVTNRKREFAIQPLKKLGIIGLFDTIVGGDNVVCMKPSSCPLDTVRSALKVPKERSIMIGDMDIDVIAGKSAGMLTCAVTYGIGPRTAITQAGPDFLIDDLITLTTLIT